MNGDNENDATHENTGAEFCIVCTTSKQITKYLDVFEIAMRILLYMYR